MIRKETTDEMAEAFCREKLLPFERHFDECHADDPEAALASLAKWEEQLPVLRRKFLLERAEGAYRALLAAAKSGPYMEEARLALGRMVEENLSWVRNNVATVPDIPLDEMRFMARFEEVAMEFQKALEELGGPRPAPTSTLEAVAAKVDAIHAKADAIHGDTTELKAAVPAAIAGQATEIRNREAELGQLKSALSKRIEELFAVFGQIDAADMQVYVAFMREGNQVKAAARLGMKEQTLRARVARWSGRGAAYARLLSLYRWRQNTNHSPKEVPFYEAAMYGEQVAPDVDAHILDDIAEIVRDIAPENLEAKRNELLSKYLKERL